jgi:protocatechuate 3,4-dioxygenase alpha subunit
VGSGQWAVDLADHLPTEACPLKYTIMSHKQTPSQTIGPFFAHGLTPEQYRYNFTSIAHPVIADTTVDGQQITVMGQVFDGNGKTVEDAMLEFWQCDADGRYPRKEQDPQSPGLKGFGRVGTGTNDLHQYEIRTVKPGAIEGQAPHINVIVFMRGMLNHLFTRIYFSDEAELNEKDEILNLVPPSRRKTLLAKRKEMDGMVVYQFDIHMQGEEETVFFDW